VSHAQAGRAGALAALVLGGATWALLGRVGSAAPPSLLVWPVSPLVKVRPDDRAPARTAAAVELWAGRNEFEPFQVVVRAEGADTAGVDVEVSDLVGAQGRRLPADLVTVYLESFLEVRKPSSIEGETGEWPDALVPRVDRYAGERRNAFPFRVRAGRSQPVWIEVYVPTSAVPGIYAGEVHVRAEGQPPVALPITLTVWSFTLPSTSSLPTAFGLSGTGALKQHRGGYTNDDELRQFTRLYNRALLLHRLSSYGGTFAPPTFHRGAAGAVDIDWRAYDEEVGPFLDGRVLGDGDPLPGARATSIDLRTAGGMDDDTRRAYWRAWLHHFDEKGWRDRLYYYLWDEPARADYSRLNENGRAARAADTSLPTLVTAPFDEAIAPVVSIWTPVVNCVDDKPVSDRFCPDAPTTMAPYDSERRQGKHLWWYQSCASHGCNIVGGSYFTGWPSYAVDVDATAHRVMEWLTWKYRMEGELYYATNEAFNDATDPWRDVARHGGNGDGTLFYPGRPDRIGGRTDIPIESLRLKLIREGLEDYEYFTLLSRAGGRDLVDAQVASVVRRTFDWDRRPASFESARRELGASLDRRLR
jgi:hypothetical protein